MGKRWVRLGILCAAAIACAHAQWKHPSPRAPRTKDGTVNLTAPAPRLNGKPDLTGLWQADRTPEREYARVLGSEFSGLQIDLHDINKDTLNIFWGLKPEEEPLTAAGAAVYKQHQADPLAYPHTQCLP